MKKNKDAENNSIIIENETLKYENKVLKKENDKLRNEFQEVNMKYHTIVDSRLWKITGPARRIYLKTKRAIKKPILKKDNVNSLIQPNQVEEKNIMPHTRIPAKDLIKKLEKYEIISFDIFDTLVFRYFHKPTEVFQMMENDLGLFGFAKNRVLAESNARTENKKNDYEITIFDIYEELKKYMKIDDDLYKVELEQEKKYCYANEYMLEVFDGLRKKQKKIVITTDMYWPQKMLKELLEHLGYNLKGIPIFVSGEYKKNKGSGELQEIVSKKYKTKNIIHIGDNVIADIEMSKKNGWGTFYYPRSEMLLEKPIPIIENSLLYSNYYAFVTNYLHSGSKIYDEYYQYGFKYVGILVYGFIEYINNIMKTYKYDKLLFLSRDMYVIYEAYTKYFNNYPNEYVLVSRSAMLEVNFEDQVEEFINFYFKSRAAMQKYTVESSLVETDLDFLLPYITEYDMNKYTVLCNENFDSIRSLIYDYKELIIEHFASSKNSALEYFKNILNGSKKVLAVDLGWSGSILTNLNAFLKNNLDKNIDVHAAFVGNKDGLYVNNLIENHIFHPYAFSFKNKEHYLDTATLDGNSKAMLMESIFTSAEPSLLKYEKNDFIFASQTTNDKEVLKGIHEGVIDFIRLYHELNQKLDLHFDHPANICFKPLFYILGDYRYQNSIFGSFKEYIDSLPRFSGDREITTLEQIFKNRNMI